MISSTNLLLDDQHCGKKMGDLPIFCSTLHRFKFLFVGPDGCCCLFHLLNIFAPINCNLVLSWYSSMKKNWERFRWFLNRKLTFLAHFDTSPLHQFSKSNNFLWVCWFLCKNLSNFQPPTWKLNNPYYHTAHMYL